MESTVSTAATTKEMPVPSRAGVARPKLITPDFAKRMMVEGQRAPPIPESQKDRELGLIRQVVETLAPRLGDKEKGELIAAANKARQVIISPKAEFLASLTNGCFMEALQLFSEIEGGQK